MLIPTFLVACGTGATGGAGSHARSAPNPIGPIELSALEPLWSAADGVGPIQALGDVTGDGLVDVVVEVGPLGTGTVVAGPLDRAIMLSTGRVAWAEGYGIGPLGDVTGDGIADVRLLESGSLEGYRLLAGPIAGDLVAAVPGLVLDGVSRPEFGDATFDGISDLVRTTGSTVEVIAGPMSRFASEPPTFSITYTAVPEDGESCNSIVDEVPEAGRLESAGDLDGDGIDDVQLVASSFVVCPQLQRLILEAGVVGNIQADANSSGPLARTYGVTAVGDQDGDGIGDILLDNGPHERQLLAGPARVEEGVLATGALMATVPDGVGLEPIADVDDDGLSDWLVTEERYVDSLQILNFKLVRGGSSLGLDEVLAWWSTPGGGGHRVVGDVLLVEGALGVHVLPLRPADQ